MPANSEIAAKYKSYIGRVFLLRKHKLIPASLERKAGRRREYFDRMETFGDACLVFDETNARVKVTRLEGGFLWISKFYLHKEVTSSNFSNYDYITSLIDKLFNTAKDIQSNKEQQELLHEVAQALKQYADILKTK